MAELGQCGARAPGADPPADATAPFAARTSNPFHLRTSNTLGGELDEGPLGSAETSLGARSGVPAAEDVDHRSGILRRMAGGHRTVEQPGKEIRNLAVNAGVARLLLQPGHRGRDDLYRGGDRVGMRRGRNERLEVGSETPD